MATLPVCAFGSRSRPEKCLHLLLTSSSFSVCDLSRVTVVLSSVFSSSNCCTLRREGRRGQTICSSPLLPQEERYQKARERI